MRAFARKSGVMRVSLPPLDVNGNVCYSSDECTPVLVCGIRIMKFK